VFDNLNSHKGQLEIDLFGLFRFLWHVLGACLDVSYVCPSWWTWKGCWRFRWYMMETGMKIQYIVWASANITLLRTDTYPTPGKGRSWTQKCRLVGDNYVSSLDDITFRISRAWLFRIFPEWNSKSALIWMMFRHVGWQVRGLSWFFTSLHSWKSLGCLQVPLVLFSLTWVHWPLCGVAPWLRAPRSLDEARGMKPSKAPRVETYPYGPIPKKLDDDVEEDEHPGKKKKDRMGFELRGWIWAWGRKKCWSLELSFWWCWFY